MRTVKLIDEKATLALAETIGSVLESGDCLILTGELGAGKTTFTKGLAKGLGIEQMVKSPTYTIVREYRKGRLPLFHMDVYRLEDGADDLGLEEYFEAEGVTVIEWGQIIAADLPPDYVELILSYQAELGQRELTLKSVGSKGQRQLERILKVVEKQKK